MSAVYEVIKSIRETYRITGRRPKEFVVSREKFVNLLDDPIILSVVYNAVDRDAETITIDGVIIRPAA